MKATSHPWQQGPEELIKQALIHLNNNTEHDLRISFLLLDVGVETLFKTFLTIDTKITKLKSSYNERKKAASSNFHLLLEQINKEVGGKLEQANIDTSHISFFHDIRNKLYHQGNGITIPKEKVFNYAEISVKLLKLLLDIDLFYELEKPKMITKRKEKYVKQKQELDQIIQKIQEIISDIKYEIEMAIELIEPNLLLPSFKNSLEPFDIYEDSFAEKKAKIFSIINKYLDVDAGEYLSEQTSLMSMDGKVSVNDEESIYKPYYGIHRRFKNLPIGNYNVNTLTLEQFCDEPILLYIRILDDLNIIDTKIRLTEIFTFACDFCIWNRNEEYLTKVSIEDEISRGEKLINDLRKVKLTICEWQ